MSSREPGKLARLLWMGIGLISLLSMAVVLRENRADFFTDFRTAISIFLGVLATCGLLFNWGAVIPCIGLGILVVKLLTNPIAGSPEEAVFKDLGIPLIGAVLGAMMGWLFDGNVGHD
jgi:hypothetical protein